MRDELVENWQAGQQQPQSSRRSVKSACGLGDASRAAGATGAEVFVNDRPCGLFAAAAAAGYRQLILHIE